jgi:hypothetical protein
MGIAWGLLKLTRSSSSPAEMFHSPPLFPLFSSSSTILTEFPLYLQLQRTCRAMKVTPRGHHAENVQRGSRPRFAHVLRRSCVRYERHGAPVEQRTGAASQKETVTSRSNARSSQNGRNSVTDIPTCVSPEDRQYDDTTHYLRNKLGNCMT